MTHSRLVARPIPAPGGGVHVEFETAAPVRVRGALGGSGIAARVVLDAGGEIAAYAFALLGPGGSELIAWHWHPRTLFPAPVFPHLHVAASLRITGPAGERGVFPLDKRHLPTGTVSLAMFVRMLIEEFGVEPLARDWETRLAEA